MSTHLQAKLLQVLQDHQYSRLGGRHLVETDVRVLAATNVDVQEAMKTGRFREDLYYRLNVLSINVPPLRERDRKSTRLNSSHSQISYAVFCLKKQNK